MNPLFGNKCCQDEETVKEVTKLITPQYYYPVQTCRTLLTTGVQGSAGDKITELRWYSITTKEIKYASTTFYNENTKKGVVDITDENSEPCDNMRFAKSLPIDVSTINNNIIVPLVEDKAIKIASLFLIASGDVTARLRSGESGAFISGPLTLEDSVGFVLNEGRSGWGQTAVSDYLNLVLTDGIQVGGIINYHEVS